MRHRRGNCLHDMRGGWSLIRIGQVFPSSFARTLRASLNDSPPGPD
jgi:hypothetical protein